MNKIYCLAMLPLLPALILIDILFGDIATGVPTTSKEKVQANVKQWFDIWNGR